MQDKETILKSLSELNKYVKKKGNDSRHRAMVIVTYKDKELFHNVTYVTAYNDNDDENLVIEHQPGFECKPSYSILNDIFVLRGQTLLIKSKDVFGREVSISISPMMF